MLAEGGQGATLRLTINDNNVRAATIINGTDEKATTAATGAAVTAALTAIVGSTVTAMGTDLQTGVADLRTNYEAHRVRLGGCHGAADNTNSIDRGDADSQEGAISLLNELRTQVLKHLQDSTAAAVRWHAVNEDDLKNLPIAQTATGLASATILSADLRERCYEAHRSQTANPASHGVADAVNTLNAPTLLDNIIVAYFDALAIIDPPIVSGDPEGAIDADHRYGFERGEA
jgi:hypothetical protein